MILLIGYYEDSDPRRGAGATAAKHEQRRIEFLISRRCAF